MEFYSKTHCRIVEFVERYKMIYSLLNISFVNGIVANDFLLILRVFYGRNIYVPLLCCL